MTPTKERQRAAARARLERQMAERKAAARKRRRAQITVAAAAVFVLVVAGGVWAVVHFGGGDDEPATTAANATCSFSELPDDAKTPQVKDVGLPPGTVPNTGTQIMNVNTSAGTIKVKMNRAEAPCIAANFAYLAEKSFYNDTKCHRAFEGMLQCGDPSAKGKGWRDTDGTGGPSYRFPDENLPINDKPAYPRGTMAMANSGENTNGSQFFFIYKDTELDGAQYAVVGTLDEASLKVLDEIGKAGIDSAEGVGHPKKEVVIKSVTLDPPVE